MTKFKSVLKRELKYMWGASFMQVVIFIAIYMTINIIMATCLGTYIKNHQVNFFYYIFRGIEYIESFDNVPIPTLWLIINISIVYIVGDSVQKGYDSNSIYVVVRSSKRKFWTSQVIVSLIITVIYYTILFGITFFIGKIFANSNSLSLDWNIIVLYVTTSIMFIVFSNFVGLLCGFKYNFLIIAILFVLSFLGESSFLPGQHSLILRHVPYDMNHNLTVIKSLIYNLIFTIIFFLMGFIISDKKDIK